MGMSFLPIALFGAILLYSATSIEATKEKAATYKVHVNEIGASFDETVKVDEKEDTVTYHVPAHNDLDEADIIHDFKKKLSLFRHHLKRECYLAPLAKAAIPSPKKLEKDMEKVSKSQNSGSNEQIQTVENKWEIVGKLGDRSLLSPEMAKLCLMYPIFRVKPYHDSVTVAKIIKNKSHRKARSSSNHCQGIKSHPAGVDCNGRLTKVCFIKSKSCVYQTECAYATSGHARYTCKKKHIYDDIICCKTVCRRSY